MLKSDSIWLFCISVLAEAVAQKRQQDLAGFAPASVDPQRLIEAAAQWEVDQAFGSPALWNTVVRWCEREKVQRPFPTLNGSLTDIIRAMPFWIRHRNCRISTSLFAKRLTSMTSLCFAEANEMAC